MLLFCPSCSNLLTIRAIPYGDLCDEDKGYAGRNAFECQTCPYQMYLDKQYFERKKMEAKAVEDVLGGADSWKNVDKTSVNCENPKCDNDEAFFRQMQIRSADEPMTTFYKCTACGADWREN